MTTIHRHNRKPNRHEKKSQRQEHMKSLLVGEGLYVYRNKNKIATLNLPKPTKSGQTTIAPNGEWQGDNYYMSLVRAGEASLVREIHPPQQEKIMSEEQKLIVDQPEKVTNEGVVEHVIPTTKPEKLTENNPSNKKDVLLNEDPISGVDIIVD